MLYRTEEKIGDNPEEISMAIEGEGTIETHYRNCYLCEAVCGLEIKTADVHVISVRGDKDDPLSQSHICPKGVAIKDMHKDPDRL